MENKSVKRARCVQVVCVIIALSVAVYAVVSLLLNRDVDVLEFVIACLILAINTLTCRACNECLYIEKNKKKKV